MAKDRAKVSGIVRGFVLRVEGDAEAVRKALHGVGEAFAAAFDGAADGEPPPAAAGPEVEVPQPAKTERARK